MKRTLFLAITSVFLGSAYATGYNLNAPILPDPKLSPGDVLTSDPAMVCVSGYTKTVRNVPQSLKNEVYREYGIVSRQKGEYEIDHIISLELGGSNSLRNLFPQSYQTQPANAHTKDALENRLHDLACSGKITLQEAQRAISANWLTAYTRYVGPLPGGAQTPPVPPLPPAATPVPAVPPAPGAGGSAPASGSVTPGADGGCPATAPIKISKAGLYHLPQGDGSYSRTHATACFSDVQSAQAAGFRGVK